MKKLLLPLTLFSLSSCTLLPQNNDKGVENISENKVITLIQKDVKVSSNAFNKSYIYTTLIIDDEKVKRNYFKKQEVIRRYPAPKSIAVKCSYGLSPRSAYNIHLYQGKIEEGKIYIFQCNGIDAVNVKEVEKFDSLG